ncbi:MAG TPA: hypothetical protein VII51_07640, partial [Gaiellaceae bacterium]
VAESDAARAAALLDAGGLDPVTRRFRAGSAIGAGTTRTIAALWHPGLGSEALALRVAAMDRAFHDHGAHHSVVIPGAVEALAALAAEGYTDRVHLGHDAACFYDFMVGNPPFADERPDYLHISRNIVPQLLAAGVTQAQIDEMFVGNPRRFFAPAAAG